LEAAAGIEFIEEDGAVIPCGSPDAESTNDSPPSRAIPGRGGPGKKIGHKIGHFGGSIENRSVISYRYLRSANFGHLEPPTDTIICCEMIDVAKLLACFVVSLFRSYEAGGEGKWHSIAVTADGDAP
jgi:hypothetical protein